MPSTHARWRGAKSSLASRSRDHHALDPVVPVLGDQQIAVDIDRQSDGLIKFADALPTATNHMFGNGINAIRKTENLDPIVAGIGHDEASLAIKQHAFRPTELARLTSDPTHGPPMPTIRIKHLDPMVSRVRNCQVSASVHSETDGCIEFASAIAWATQGTEETPLGGEPLDPVITGVCNKHDAGMRDNHPTRNRKPIRPRSGSTPNPTDPAIRGEELDSVVATVRYNYRPIRQIGDALGKPDLAGCRPDGPKDAEGIAVCGYMLDTGVAGIDDQDRPVGERG